MSDKKTVTVRFPSLATFLTALFVTLKLTEVGTVRTWSWWWVFSPLWIPVAILFTVWGLAVVAAAIDELLN